MSDYLFDAQGYRSLCTLFKGRTPFLNSTPYAGYKPAVGELPDMRTRDAGKRWLHVALKYDPPRWAEPLLARAHWLACKVALALGVPPLYMPSAENGTLRVLEYPAGTGTAEHTDPNLFTIVCWRSHRDGLELGRAATASTLGHALAGFPDVPSCQDCGEVAPEPGSTCWKARPVISPARAAAEALAPGLHIGELGEMVGLGRATPHRVPAREYAQGSIVYFASPAMQAPLPAPVFMPGTHERPDLVAQTCGEWQKERIARSRYSA